MTAVGGSIESVSLDGRTFAVPADNEAQRNLGGFANTVLPNGNGTARLQKQRQPWSFSGLQLVIDDDRGDQEFLQDLLNQRGFFPVAVIHASGEVYQGEGQMTGDDGLSVNTQNQTAEVALSGPGRFTKQ